MGKIGEIKMDCDQVNLKTAVQFFSSVAIDL